MDGAWSSWLASLYAPSWQATGPAGALPGGAWRGATDREAKAAQNQPAELVGIRWSSERLATFETFDATLRNQYGATVDAEYRKQIERG
jgi:hypothetical protein